MNLGNKSKDIIRICKIFQESGWEIFLIGGCIRDILLGNEPNDFDFASNALPQEVKKLFKKSILTGEKHGTITIIFNLKSYEITTYRVENEYINKRKPKNVEYINDLKEDIKRRDFTINGIAYSPLKEEIIDYYNGRADIKRRLIKCIGNPINRFEEDALRIMRACRFSAKLNFQIEKNTLEAMKYKKENLKFIAKERIKSEIEQILSCKNLKNALIYLNKIQFFPNYLKIKPISKKLIAKIALLSEENQYLKVITFLLLDKNNSDSEKILRDLKFSNLEIKTILLYHKVLNEEKLWKIKKDNVKIKELIHSAKRENIFNILDIAKILNRRKGSYKKILKSIKKYNLLNQALFLNELKVNGQDIKKLNLFREEKIGIVLKKLLKEVIKNPKLNKKEILLEKVKKICLNP